MGLYFDYKNIDQFEQLYFHDSFFRGYQYNHERKTVTAVFLQGMTENECLRLYSNNEYIYKYINSLPKPDIYSKVFLTFENVLYHEMIGCEFGGPGGNIYEVWSEAECDRIPYLKSLNEDVIEKESRERNVLKLNDRTSIQIVIAVTNLDFMRIVCKKVLLEIEYITEEEWEHYFIDSNTEVPSKGLEKLSGCPYPVE